MGERGQGPEGRPKTGDTARRARAPGRATRAKAAGAEPRRRPAQPAPPGRDRETGGEDGEGGEQTATYDCWSSHSQVSLKSLSELNDPPPNKTSCLVEASKVIEVNRPDG